MPRQVITQKFPSSTHGLAGGVTNTLAQLGMSLGVNFTAIIATAVAMSSAGESASPMALEKGYKAAFWASFAATALMLIVTAWGMKGVGMVGTAKTD